MKNKLFRGLFISITLSVAVSLSFVTIYAGAGVDRPKYGSNPSADKRIDYIEKSLEQIRNTEMAKSYSSTLNNTEVRKEKVKSVNEKSKAFFIKEGIKPVSNSDDVSYDSKSITPMSTSSQISLTDQLFYDSVSGTYLFYASFDFTNGSGWDSYKDIDDLMAVRMNNTTGYYIYATYANTYATKLKPSGKTETYKTGDCANGSSDPSSRINKRFEDAAGVCFNIRDDYYSNDLTLERTYYTDVGYVSHYIKKTSGGINKIFLDYHHNFKTYSWNASAKISSAKLGSVSGILEVTYSISNVSWQRCSQGKIIQ